MKTEPTPEARIWASLSHLSALAFGMGIALPVIGWSDQRRKSNYASFQCLQALGYQSLGFTAWALSSLLAIVVTAVVLLARLSAAAPGSGRSLEALRPGAIAGFVVLAGLSALYCFLPVQAAILSG